MVNITKGRARNRCIWDGEGRLQSKVVVMIKASPVNAEIHPIFYTYVKEGPKFRNYYFLPEEH